jgi:hypothetical protein
MPHSSDPRPPVSGEPSAEDRGHRFPGRRFHTALGGRVSWYCIPEARATPPSLDARPIRFSDGSPDQAAYYQAPTTPPSLDANGLPNSDERRRAAYVITALPHQLKLDFIREIGRQIGYEVRRNDR